MALQKGERYCCQDPDCGYEIEVTKRHSRAKVAIRATLLLRA